MNEDNENFSITLITEESGVQKKSWSVGMLVFPDDVGISCGRHLYSFRAQK